MFSVYGKTGLSYRGSMEALPRVGPAERLQRAKRVGPADTEQSSGSGFAELLGHPPADVEHRIAIAAYAETARQDQERRPLTRVDDVMTRRVTMISSMSTVGEAWTLLARDHVGQAPVVGADGVLVGLLSRADLLHPDRLPGPLDHAVKWQVLLARSVMDLMWTPVPSVASDTDLRRVARVLLDTGLSGLPVVDDAGLVTGFISRSDILRAVVADPPLDLWS